MTTPPDLLLPLSGAEQAELGRLLASGPTATGRRLDLAGADGSLHGLLVLPRPAPASEWIGDLSPESAMLTQGQAGRFFELLMRRYNMVAAAMRGGQPEPLSDGSAAQSGSWLTGFAQALTRDPNAMVQLNRSDEGAQLMLMLMSYATQDLSGQARLNQGGRFREIMGDLHSAHAHSQSVLESSDPAQNLSFLRAVAGICQKVLARPNPQRRAGRKTGPNEPCPCGSGKKHKKCCGRPGA
jgi:Uncharacterised protein family (UPF0149)/SEC-C motif